MDGVDGRTPLELHIDVLRAQLTDKAWGVASDAPKGRNFFANDVMHMDGLNGHWLKAMVTQMVYFSEFSEGRVKCVFLSENMRQPYSIIIFWCERDSYYFLLVFLCMGVIFLARTRDLLYSIRTNSPTHFEI